MLRGPYRHKEFGTVILPFTVLARFDSVLADTKEAVLEASERYEKSPSLMRHEMLRRASGHSFYNTSPYTLPSLTGDSANIKANTCGSNAAYVGSIDDLLVFTGNKAIDGPGGILAQSGPCSVRTSGGLTIYSTLVFDTADLAQFKHPLGLHHLDKHFRQLFGLHNEIFWFLRQDFHLRVRRWRSFVCSNDIIP